MHTEQRQRARDFLQSRSIDRALFASPFSVAWLTGFVPPPQLTPSAFAGGPPLVWYEGGQFTLITIDLHDTAGITVPVHNYTGYTIDRPIPGPANLQEIVRDLTGRHPQAGTLGVETRHLPAFLLPSGTGAVEIDGWLDPLRMVKTAEELEKLRRAFSLADLAQQTARRAVRAGMREIEVWSAAHGAVQQAAGGLMRFGNDCVVSYRENNIGGLPGDLALRPGDSLMVDLGTRVDGYWSDGCATYYATRPDERQTKMHQTAARALALAISLVRPGIPVNEIDRRVRAVMEEAGYPVYPHHTGHGIGVSTHEEPRIVPYNPQPLEPGMVIMLEPGIYFPGEAAVRLEDAVLVTPDGAEVLTHHDKGLPSEC
jgi:Xaa-Pro dipeptidase